MMPPPCVSRVPLVAGRSCVECMCAEKCERWSALYDYDDDDDER